MAEQNTTVATTETKPSTTESKKKPKAKKGTVSLSGGYVQFETEPLNIGDQFTIKVNGQSHTVTVDGDISTFHNEGPFLVYPQVEVL